MSERIAIIENIDRYGANSAADVARVFGCRHWVVGAGRGATFMPRVASSPDLVALNEEVDTIDLYETLTARWPVVFRIKIPNYPLHPRFHAEIGDQFPEAEFDYVLSMGEECGLTGYFVERLSAPAMARLRHQHIRILPPGTLNLSGLPRSGRHFFSLELRRFLLDDNFELLFNSPRFMAVNMIGQCNYTCLKCQYHSSDLPASREYAGAMSLDRFRTILEKAKAFPRLMTVYPTLTGEPLLHAEIVEIVASIKQAGYCASFTTNGSLLTPELGERLLDAGVDGLAFSLDTLDPVKYQRLQHGGDLAEVERNLLAFRDASLRKRGTFNCSINFVVGPDNAAEREAFRRRWSAEGFNVSLSTYYDIFDNARPYFDQGQWGPASRMPCWALWLGLYLTDQGRLVTCGGMAKTLGVKESIFQMSGPELWRCEAMQALRQQQLTGVTPGYCKEFSCWTGPITTWRAEGANVEISSKSSNTFLHA